MVSFKRVLVFVLLLICSFHTSAQLLDVPEMDSISANIDTDQFLLKYSVKDTFSAVGYGDTLLITEFDVFCNSGGSIAKVIEVSYLSIGRERMFGQRIIYYFQNNLPFKIVCYPPREFKSRVTNYYKADNQMQIVGDAGLDLPARVFENALSLFSRFKK
jgi:hypothetical protein